LSSQQSAFTGATTLSINGLIGALSRNDTKHYILSAIINFNVEFHFAECRILNVVMLNVNMLNVNMLNVNMLNVVMLNVIMLDVIMLDVVMLNVVMHVMTLSITTLSIECYYAQSHVLFKSFADCHHAL
jgi:hypothetical protein